MKDLKKGQKNKKTKGADKDRENRSGGSAGSGGYNFQAEIFALIGAKMLAGESLNWIEAKGDRIPLEIMMETGEGGDDLQILLSQNIRVEIQAKRGVSRGSDLWTALINLAKAVQADSKVYGVLMTNTSASGTVRVDLKDGISRIAQGRFDDLPEIAEDFIKQLNAEGITEVEECCKRLRIIIRDFETGSSGEEETFASLRKSIAKENTVGAARNTLITKGYSVMQSRGRQNSEDLARKLLQDGIQLSQSVSNPLVLKESYLEWVAKTNDRFIITGLNLALPMELAWVKLRAMNQNSEGESNKTLLEQIRNYHEWHRLVDNFNPEETFDVEKVVGKEKQIVIVAGPGAGKSTLLRRVALTLSQEHELSFRVSLSNLALRLGKGEEFNDALISAAAGEGFNKEILCKLFQLGKITLLADGLDETGAERAQIADKLRNWTLAQENRQLIVTTRPIGHNPAWFGDWAHLELLPLNFSDVESFANVVYTKLFPNDEAKAKQNAENFLDKLKASKTAKIASRNPQLLGILITLHQRGDNLGGKRYRLFDKAIETIREQNNVDRVFIHDLSTPLSQRALEVIGWQLIQQPTITRQILIKRLGSVFAQELGEPTLVAEQIAEKALDFWEERGIIERLAVASETIYIFVHLSFRDFSAANHLSKLTNHDFSEWVRNYGLQPEFRETLLLTAGTEKLEICLDTLLSLDNPSDPISIAAIIAADVFAEAESPSPDLREKLASHLIPRLNSMIPFIAYEAAEKMQIITALAPKLIGPIALTLTEDSNIWVKEIGCALGLIAGTEYVNEKALIEVYPNSKDTFFTSGRFGVSINSNPIAKILLVKGTEYLLTNDKSSEYKKIVKSKLEEADFSFGVWEQISKIWMKQVNESEKLEYALGLDRNNSIDWESIGSTNEKIYEIITDTIRTAALKLSSNKNKSAPDPDLKSIKILYQMLDMGKEYITTFYEILHRPYQDGFNEMMRGAILAAELDPDQILADVESLIKDIKSFQKKVSDDSDLQIEPNWNRAKQGELQSEFLFQAVRHPAWFVAKFAASLLWNTKDLDFLREEFKKLLKDGEGNSIVIIVQVAIELWGNETANLFLNRLECNLTKDCALILNNMLNLDLTANEIERTKNVLRHVFNIRDKYLVESALNLVEKLDLINDLHSEIQTAYRWWLTEGPPGPKGSGVVPPNASAALLKHLASKGNLSYEKLQEAIIEAEKRNISEVKTVAVDALINLMVQNTTLIPVLLKKIKKGNLTTAVLDKLSTAYPSVCKPFFDDIIHLLDSDKPNVILSCIRSLGDGWCDFEKTESILRSLLDAEKTSVRSEAVKVLRRVLNIS